MYGDVEVMRKQASRLREQGEAIRRLADGLVGQAEGVPWTGRAADAMRERIRERASRLRQVADRHDVAAGSMETHLITVEDLKESIDQVERRSRRLSEDGASLAFEIPAPGHRDWLVVSLPPSVEPARSSGPSGDFGPSEPPPPSAPGQA